MGTNSSSTLAADRHSRPIWLSRLKTIRSRLYVAFGIAAFMTVVGSLFALYGSSSIGATMTEIISDSMPATIGSLRLSQEASILVASAPRLMSAEDDTHRAAIEKEINAQTQTLYSSIEHLRGLDPKNSIAIDNAVTALNDRFGALDKAVTERIKLSVQRRDLALSIHKLQEGLLEALTPAIDDAYFDLMTRDQTSGHDTRLIEGFRHLLQMQAKLNQMAGLLIEASLVTDTTDLPPLHDLIAAANRNAKIDLNALPEFNGRGKITALYARLAELAGDQGMITVRQNELARQRESQLAFAAALTEAANLKNAVDALTERESAYAQTLFARASSQIRIGRAILIALSLTALLAAALIAWLYVGRSIVGRLIALGSAMKRIARGERNVAIPVGGADEIAEMADALVIFRAAIEDLSTAKQGEAQRAQESESHNRELQSATQNFQSAVNDIIQGLDDASKSMDSCAHMMAETSQHNQAQVLAAASASTEATANAHNVAEAAEEIARSVEQIADQARLSADIARRATTEATTTIAAVGKLVTSVDHINSMSNLIREIAAQTNLLALNATIEAARAGDAGRGFAVVAQEVKGLAAQTEKATEAITQQISGIQQTTSQAVEAMTTIAGTISKLDANAIGIATAVQQQDAVTKEIAQTSTAAANFTRTVSVNLVAVSDAAAKTSEVAHAVLNAGGELGARAKKLRDEVERFLSQLHVA